MPEKRPSGPKRPNDFYRYSGMAIKMAVVILLGVMGGQKLDKMSANESPWYTITLSLFSVAVAIYVVISDTKR